MKSWKKALLTVSLFLIVLFDIVAARLILFNSGRGIYFLSLKVGYSWKVDKDKLVAYEGQLQSRLGYKPRVLILFSPKFKKTPLSTGIGENAVYYGKWNRQFGWNIFTVYIDTREYSKVSPEEKKTMLGSWLVREINTKTGVGRYTISVPEPFVRI